VQQRSIAAVLLSSSLILASCGGETAKSGRESSKATTAEASFAARVETVRKRAEALAKSAPGVIVSVRDGNDRKVLAIGDAARDPERKLTPDDTVMIASVTKALVATAALSLVQDGSLRLDDPVEKWLPGLLAKGRRITVEQLWSMSSGLPNYEDSPDFPEAGVLPPKALVDLIAKQPLDFEPGTQGAQSNTNYAVLQLVLERAGRAPLDELLTQRVLKPAGLTHTMLGGTPTALGYDGDQDATIGDPQNPSAAAGAVSSVGDVERFLDALTAAKILDAKDTEAMQKVHASVEGEDYGLGLLVHHQLSCGTALGQVGENAGYVMDAWTLPDKARTVVVAATSGAAGLEVERVAESALCP
jgi:D-alanyl-D-alanine carboxypeptidase